MHQRSTGPGMGRTIAAATLVAAALACGAGFPAPAAATSPVLVGEWRFDEAGGQIAFDSGPNRLDGRLGASAGPDAADPARIAGASGGALHFDGAGYVRLPDSNQLDIEYLTAEAVVRAPASPGAHRYVMSRGSKGCFAGSYGLYTAAAGGIALYVFDGSRYIVSATARPADVWNGRWHHVAGTFDGSVLRLYLDGRQVGAATSAPVTVDYAGTAPGAFFGRFAGDCDLDFRGDLDLVRVWAAARSAGQVGEQAESALGPAAPAPGGMPLPPAAPGRVIPGPGGPGQVRSSCVLRLSHTHVAVARRTVVRVRVGSRRHPASAVRVTARRAGKPRVLARALTDSRGRGRLVLDVRHAGRLRIRAANRTRLCRPAFVRVQQAF